LLKANSTGTSHHHCPLCDDGRWGVTGRSGSAGRGGMGGRSDVGRYTITGRD